MYLVNILGGKRLETVPVKFSDAEKRMLHEISQIEDRPLGYIVRELMLRGLIDYAKDKNLRAEPSEVENAAKKVRNNLSAIKGKELAPNSKNKIPFRDGKINSDDKSKAA